MKKQFGLDKVLVINPRTNQWNRESNIIYLNFNILSFEINRLHFWYKF
jgi:hypothetical protein